MEATTITTFGRFHITDDGGTFSVRQASGTVVEYFDFLAPRNARGVAPTRVAKGLTFTVALEVAELLEADEAAADDAAASERAADPDGIFL